MNAAPQMQALASGGALQAAARRAPLPHAPPGDDALPSFASQFAQARRASPEAEERDACQTGAEPAAPTTPPPAPADGAVPVLACPTGTSGQAVGTPDPADGHAAAVGAVGQRHAAGPCGLPGQATTEIPGEGATDTDALLGDATATQPAASGHPSGAGRSAHALSRRPPAADQAAAGTTVRPPTSTGQPLAGEARSESAAVRDDAFAALRRREPVEPAPTAMPRGAVPGAGADALSPAGAMAAAGTPAVATDTPAAAPGAAYAEARLPQHPSSARFAPALGQQIQVFIREGVQHARLHLNPEDMGPISVRVSVDGDAAQVVLAADLPATRQALEQAMPVLASALREDGLTLTGGGVFEQPRQTSDERPRGDARGGAERGDGPQDGGRHAAGTEGAPMPPRAPQRRPAGALDVYA